MRPLHERPIYESIVTKGIMLRLLEVYNEKLRKEYI